MSNLYDEYDPVVNPIGPMNRLYRSKTGPFPDRVVQFAGIVLAKTKEREEVLNLWLTDFLTDAMDCHLTSREGLKVFQRVMPDELGEAGARRIDEKARQYAEMCVAFGELCRDSNAGKGPEHFGGPFPY